MLLVLSCLLAAAAAAPASYDQRQDGDFNVRADVQNIVFLVAIPEKLHIPASLLYGFLKNSKQNHETEIQDRADVHVMEAFVEPSEPYHVEIGESTRSAGGDGRAVEVLIAARRRLDSEPAVEAEVESEPQVQNEYKLIGATEQCGPDAERDPVSLTCRPRAPPAPRPADAAAAASQSADAAAAASQPAYAAAAASQSADDAVAASQPAEDAAAASQPAEKLPQIAQQVPKVVPATT